MPRPLIRNIFSTDRFSLDFYCTQDSKRRLRLCCCLHFPFVLFPTVQEKAKSEKAAACRFSYADASAGERAAKNSKGKKKTKVESGNKTKQKTHLV